MFVQVTKAELNNGVINACFMMLFKDLIRLLACYNDGIINLLGTYRCLFVSLFFDIVLLILVTSLTQGRLHNGGMVRDAPWRK